ncbi:MAG: WD40 repeat domain-containing protein [Rhizobiales bacterium]|nr:WD40 repeat domain-containing protein [Hyphomicrobiales bacterium]
MKKILAIVFSLFLVSCSEDPNEAANRMFVETQKLVSEATVKPREQALVDLYAAIDSLNRIVDEYPSSNLAVQISSGQSIGTISISSISEAIGGLYQTALFVFTGHEGKVYHAVFSPDGTKVLTASGDKTARLWDIATGNQIAVFTGHEGTIFSAVFSPDGTRVLTVSFDHTARLWDIATGNQVAVFTDHERVMYHPVFSPDGSSVLTASADKTARLWDIATGNQVAVFTGSEGEVYHAVFSPDGSSVLTASYDHTARLWDIGNNADFSTREGFATIFETEPAAQDSIFMGHEGVVNSAVFSPDGTRVLTASFDRTARLWDIATGNHVAVFAGHEGVVFSAVFSPDGTRMLTASADKTARLWGIRP